PDGKWLVYQQDRGGDEQWQLFAVPSDGGDPVALTNDASIRYTTPRFSPDGKQLAIAIKPKTAAATNVGIFDMQTKQARTLTKEATQDHSWGDARWSPDAKSLFATRENSGSTD